MNRIGSYSSMTGGYVEVEEGIAEFGPNNFRRVLKSVHLVGDSPYFLPHWAEKYVMKTDSDFIQVGPYVFQMIDRDYAAGGRIVIVAGESALRWQAGQWLEMVYYRLLETLVIWNLAERKEYGEPMTWRNIRIPGKAKK